MTPCNCADCVIAERSYPYGRRMGQDCLCLMCENGLHGRRIQRASDAELRVAISHARALLDIPREDDCHLKMWLVEIEQEALKRHQKELATLPGCAKMQTPPQG